MAVVPFDLANPESITAATAAVQAQEHVEVLINNGGIAQRSLTVDTDLRVDRRIMEVDYFAAVALTKSVLPKMIARGGGSIVVVSSIAGVIPAPNRSAYCAAKHALHGFFGSLLAEEWHHGIRITLACPAPVRTAIAENALIGDGSPFSQSDPLQERGVSAAECARRVLDACERERKEVFIGGAMRHLPLLHRLLPGAYARLVRHRRR